MTGALPPGQRPAPWRPFGLPEFARFQPQAAPAPVLVVGGEVRRPAQIGLDELTYHLEAAEQRTDLHCVTTWSATDIGWGGYRFRDVHELLAERVEPRTGCEWLVVRGLDGYRACLKLEDALADDVMLAVRLDGAPLPVERGGPVRLVSPAQYGYKSVKHVYAVEYHRKYQAGRSGWMVHPRGRVAYEERSRVLPGWMWRRIWRAMLPRTAAIWERAAARRPQSGDRL